MKPSRNITKETTRLKTGKSVAVSSHLSPFFHLISPFTITRLANRKTVGAIKYGSVQWRQGINDAEYVRDRFNHFFEHLMLFMSEGNKYDDNIGAMLWALDCISEVERLCPKALKHIIANCNLYGKSATLFHQRETKQHGRKS